MKPALIENPVLNSPFAEPERHFRFDDEGITGDVIESRRPSSYFVPIPATKKKGRQLQFDTEWTQDRVEENKAINRIRDRVSVWRRGGRIGTTATTRALLDYWTRPDREKRLFFCQIEAVETAIWIAEVAPKFGEGWVLTYLREVSEAPNAGLPRIAHKMATGSGKTVVMAMLIAWQTLNKLRNPQDGRFSDTFLIVAPGITIRDRLRVLYPNAPDNFYRERDVLPAEQIAQLQEARILITNFHSFLLRERGEASRLTKTILGRGNRAAFLETPDEMVRRVCRELGGKKNIVVLNDEAHHCYRRRPDAEGLKLTGEERKEAEKRDEEARVWISGLEAIQRKIGIRTVYDLSATPFFLKGSGYSEGTLFPWVVSDFSLIDAIESGIVKVPRVPVSDDSMQGALPAYRDLWLRIRDGLPKKGRKAGEPSREPQLPAELQGALHSLYGNYVKRFEGTAAGPPPVFIVVCNNTQVSKLVFDWIAGWEKRLPDGSAVIVPGQLGLFNNEQDGGWCRRPATVLVDSEQLESGEAMSEEFKRAAAVEIDEFKREYRQRFPGRDADALTDEDLLREVMNTVGKPGRLGEHVRCVVSVSMLTEGWDANTVTHILGVRAFGTQLLCEQVVGRGLRRMSYAAIRRALAVNGREVEFDAFTPEYAEVYGVPFSFIPCSGPPADSAPPALPTRVRALEDRAALELTFPRVTGYRNEIGERAIEAKFDSSAVLALTTERIPTKVENAPIVGETTIHTLDELKRRREQEVSFLLAKLVLEKYFRQDGKMTATDGPHPAEHRFDRDVQAWRFPEILAVSRRWLQECVVLKDRTFPQLLLLVENAHDAADRIYRSIVTTSEAKSALRPILRSYDPVGSTRWVDFDTTKPVWKTDPSRCHVSHVVADTESWEQKVAQALEEMDEVESYVKNQGLGFTIPYSLNGEQRQYFPDFLVRLRHPGTDRVVHMIVEVTGERKKDKEAKVATARDLWVPAINAHGGFGQWAFVEVTDPWDAVHTVRGALRAAVFGTTPPTLDRDAIESWCRKWLVKELAIFGSYARRELKPESDIDFLVAFLPQARWSVFDLAPMQSELARIVGRDVDLVLRNGVEEGRNPIRRRKILTDLEVIYAAQ